MQTFLPYADFQKSVEVLDYKRLGKQRVETFQVLNILLSRTPTKGWRNHPVTVMWTGYESALQLYQNITIREWKKRGYKKRIWPLVFSPPLTYQVFPSTTPISARRLVWRSIGNRLSKTSRKMGSWPPKGLSPLFSKKRIGCFLKITIL